MINPEVLRALEKLTNEGIQAEAIGHILLPVIEKERARIFASIEANDPRTLTDPATILLFHLELKILRSFSDAIHTAIQRGLDASDEIRDASNRGPERSPRVQF